MGGESAQEGGYWDLCLSLAFGVWQSDRLQSGQDRGRRGWWAGDGGVRPEVACRLVVKNLGWADDLSESEEM